MKLEHTELLQSMPVFGGLHKRATDELLLRAAMGEALSAPPRRGGHT